MYNELIKDINKTFKECIENKFYFHEIERRLYIIEMYKYVIQFMRRRRMITYEEYKYLINKLNDFIVYSK